MVPPPSHVGVVAKACLLCSHTRILYRRLWRGGGRVGQITCLFCIFRKRLVRHDETKMVVHMRGRSCCLWQVGDWVIAVGNPVGLDSTVTLGIVSRWVEGLIFRVRLSCSLLLFPYTAVVSPLFGAGISENSRLPTLLNLPYSQESPLHAHFVYSHHFIRRSQQKGYGPQSVATHLYTILSSRVYTVLVGPPGLTRKAPSAHRPS